MDYLFEKFFSAPDEFGPKKIPQANTPASLRRPAGSSDFKRRDTVKLQIMEQKIENFEKLKTNNRRDLVRNYEKNFLHRNNQVFTPDYQDLPRDNQDDRPYPRINAEARQANPIDAIVSNRNRDMENYAEELDLEKMTYMRKLSFDLKRSSKARQWVNQR